MCRGRAARVGSGRGRARMRARMRAGAGTRTRTGTGARTVVVAVVVRRVVVFVFLIDLVVSTVVAGRGALAASARRVSRRCGSGSCRRRAVGGVLLVLSRVQDAGEPPLVHPSRTSGNVVPLDHIISKGAASQLLLMLLLGQGLLGRKGRRSQRH